MKLLSIWTHFRPILQLSRTLERATPLPRRQLRTVRHRNATMAIGAAAAVDREDRMRGEGRIYRVNFFNFPKIT